LKSCCVVQDHYDDERNKIVYHKTSDLQHQDRIFWSQTSLALRPMVADQITAREDAQCRMEKEEGKKEDNRLT